MSKQKSGFTLVELLVAMAIIGVILGLALFGIAAAQRNARDTARRSALQDVNAGIQDFYTIFGSYPAYIDFNTSGSIHLKSNSSACAVTGATRNCVAVPVEGAAVPSGNLALTNANTTGSGNTGGATGTGATRYCFSARTDGYSIGATLENGSVFYASTSATKACTTP